MRTEAPKDLAGRGFVNFARTTPELPAEILSAMNLPPCTGECFGHTVGTGDLAPDHTDLSTANLLLSPVNVRDLLAEIEAIFLRQWGF